MGVALIQPLHGIMYHKANAQCGGKEQHSVEQNLAQTRTGAAAGAQHTGEHHDADDIINDSSADDGSAQKTLQVSEFLQGSHRDGHTGSGHNGADEQRPVELRAANCGKAVERTI